jgi:hypothetical protein
MRSPTPPRVPTAEAERLLAAESRTRLLGARIPSVSLPFTDEARLDLGALARNHALVICVFAGLGAKQRLAAERRRLIEWTGYTSRLAQAGYRPVAISSETPTEQLRWATLTPDWVLLGDPDLLLARLLALQTMVGKDGWTYAPITLIARGGSVVGVEDAGLPEAAAVLARVEHDLG